MQLMTVTKINLSAQLYGIVTYWKHVIVCQMSFMVTKLSSHIIFVDMLAKLIIFNTMKSFMKPLGDSP